MGNADEMQTPKGLFNSSDTGLHMSYFIGNYKGGRNESFMYGADENIHCFDYDLVSAYTTAMSHLALPEYHKGHLITQEDVESMSSEDLLTGYLIINGSFNFPKEVKYPSIPCYIDSSTTVYPLTGKCLLTGPEYLLAKSQGASITFKSSYYIPPKETKRKVGPVEITTPIKPFCDIIGEIQAKRREFPKGSVLNLLYKEMGNSIYGNLVRGMSNKKSFDIKSGKMLRVGATEISNPILASWTTAFVRSVIGECLHNVSLLGGKVVSVTTDGFITDLPNLENHLMKLKKNERPLLSLYRNLRHELSQSYTAIETKQDGRGIISWTTRGQLGIGSNIKATTGFQSKGYEKVELVSTFLNTLKNRDKYFEYTRTRLRSAKDIFSQGGHVTTILNDQTFRMLYDNRRQIVETPDFEGHDLSNKLLDSKPLQNSNACKTMRFLSKLPHSKPYNKITSGRSGNTYKSFIEVGVRSFIKGYFSSDPCFGFGLKGTEFASVNPLISFIKDFDLTKDLKISNSSISRLKNRRSIQKPVPCTKENKAFAEYIKEHIPHFDITSFLK